MILPFSKRSITLLLIFIFSQIGFSQTSESQMEYSKDEYFIKLVSQAKANFSRKTLVDAEGQKTIECWDLKKNELFSREVFKGEEPFGVWFGRSSSSTYELDYDFVLNRKGEACQELIKGIKIKNILSNEDSIQYRAPIFAGPKNLFQFLAQEIYYPVPLREQGIGGKVYLQFTIDESGQTTNIFVIKGAHILLDKEAVRVIRKMKFTSPATLNGEVQAVCMVMPINFKIQ